MGESFPFQLAFICSARRVDQKWMVALCMSPVQYPSVCICVRSVCVGCCVNGLRNPFYPTISLLRRCVRHGRNGMRTYAAKHVTSVPGTRLTSSASAVCYLPESVH